MLLHPFIALPVLLLKEMDLLDQALHLPFTLRTILALILHEQQLVLQAYVWE